MTAMAPAALSSFLPVVLPLLGAFAPQATPARGGGTPAAESPAQDAPAQTQPSEQAPAEQAPARPAPTPPPAQQPPAASPPARGPQPAGRAPQQPPQTPAEPLMRQEGDEYVFNFEAVSPTDGVSVRDFVNMCNEVTGIPFYIRKEVEAKLASAKINIIGKKRVPVAQFYDFFQSLLKINDLVLVLEGGPASGVWQIADMKGQDRNLIRNSARYISPEEIAEYSAQPGILVTTVLALQYANAREISASLRPLFPDNQLETVISLGNTNGLLVTGFGPTVNNLSQLMRLIDTPPTEPKPIFEVIELEHASADEVFQILDDLIERGRRAGGAAAPAQGVTGAPISGQAPELKIRVDGRSNSLLVVGLQEDVQQILEIVARIDKAQPEPESDFHVYTLKNVKAVDFAKMLQEFIDKSHQSISRTPSTAGGTGGTGGGRSGGTGGTGGGRETKPVVVADEGSNSLLITATKTRWLEIRDVIERLDRRQAQVLLETALVELTTDDAIRLGVELGLVDVPGDDSSKGFGITSFGLSSLIDTDGDNFPDTRIPDASLQGVTGGILSGPDFGIPLLVQALRTRSDSNVLSIPSVLVNNNEKAKVKAIDQIPTATTTNTVNVGSQTTFAGYQEAGIELDITPSISAQNYLRLDLSLKVSTFTAAQGTNPAIPPPKTERQIVTTVYLPSESTMVIGGIRLDDALHSKSGIPILGDIPLLGFLFSASNDTNRKRSLYFFVTPHILSDLEFADLQNISYQRKLDARTYIGEDRIRIVDPQFRAIQPDPGPGGTAVYDAGLFEIPLYRSPRAGEVAPSEAGVRPPPPPPPARREDEASPPASPPADSGKG